MPFIGKLKGEFLGKRQFKLLCDFAYETIGGITITVPKDFVSDGASIPRIFWSLIGSPWDSEYGYAAVIHDYGYATQRYSRKYVDDIFLEGMTEKNVPLLKRRIMYRAVRVWSWIPWLIHKRRLKRK